MRDRQTQVRMRFLTSRRSFLIQIIAACGATFTHAHATTHRPLLVFAGASLQGVLNRIAEGWQSETGGRVTFSFAGSHTLARQIDQGAPADIFASADEDWMDWAQKRNLIKPQTRRPVIANRLVLVVAKDDPVALSIETGFALAREIGTGRLAMANPDAVPAGRYAREALTSLGVWDSVKGRIATTDNVRAALALVARGEARFGIVYATDAAIERRVRVLGTFAETSHSAIIYPFAVTASSNHPDAEAFLRYLSTPTARRMFDEAGFLQVR